MHGTIRSASLALAFTLMATGTALSQAPDGASPLNGTWKLDPAASRIASERTMQSETRVYEINGDKVKLTVTGTDGAGKPFKFSYSAAYDGKFTR